MPVRIIPTAPDLAAWATDWKRTSTEGRCPLTFSPGYMRTAGAYTIGQDKESCVVYGMPMVAQNIGAVTIQASCANIPSVLMNYLNTL